MSDADPRMRDESYKRVPTLDGLYDIDPEYSCCWTPENTVDINDRSLLRSIACWWHGHVWIETSHITARGSGNYSCLMGGKARICVRCKIVDCWHWPFGEGKRYEVAEGEYHVRRVTITPCGKCRRRLISSDSRIAYSPDRAFDLLKAEREAVGKTLDATSFGSGTGEVIRAVDRAWRNDGEEAARQVARSYC